MNSRTLVKTAVASTFIAAAIISQLAYAENEAIIERVKPAGQLVIKAEDKTEESADTASAKSATEKASVGSANDGKATYGTSCAACHGTGVAGAPIVGKKDAWTARVSKGKEALYKNAINGINAMPPKGGAASLSDEDIKAVVDYMVEQSS